METKFNSQLSTSLEQSRRVLELGLKPETADMVWISMSGGHYIYASPWSNHKRPQDIPAWSLHRLWELGQFMGINLSAKEHIARLYDFAIDHIEKEIKEGYFNKAYLEE